MPAFTMPHGADLTLRTANPVKPASGPGRFKLVDDLHGMRRPTFTRYVYPAVDPTPPLDTFLARRRQMMSSSGEY